MRDRTTGPETTRDPRDLHGPRAVSSDERDESEACCDTPQSMGMRENARTMLERLRHQHLRRVASINALLDALPARLPPEADEVLWEALRSSYLRP